MSFSRFMMLCTLPFLALGAKQHSVTDDFALFGYGKDFGGLPLFYADGYAYIGEATQSNISNAAPVTCEFPSADVWIGNPNTTLLTNATAASWSNVTFYIPENTNSDKRIGFLSSGESTDGVIETGYSFYGSTAMLKDNDGTLASSFYALNISERVYRLYWNDTSLGQVPVVLRSIAPSNLSN
ncbi:hypothetical protein EJ07DRAFT_135667 [Lizonia empirigonia]|nr:hypothetical protein EJ07DRAFT_135667 [Lizonia empirigonia]